MSPEMTVANALADKFIMEHNGNHMAGMVLGITVTGNRPPLAAHGRTRKIRLWVRERPAAHGLPAGFGYQVEEKHRLFPKDLTVPGPPLVLGARPASRNNRRQSTARINYGSLAQRGSGKLLRRSGGLGRDAAMKSLPRFSQVDSFRVRFTPATCRDIHVSHTFAR